MKRDHTSALMGPARSEPEQRHRRRVLLAIGLLIALTTSPVFGHHFALAMVPLLAGHEHLLSLCLVALRELFVPVHEASHVLFVAGLGYAVADRARAAWNARRTLRLLTTARPLPGGIVWSLARDAGVGQRLFLVDGLPVPAFTAGWIRPRIYVSSDLPSLLDAGELRAVIAHEAAHVRRRDPLRFSLLRFLACTLFYVPVLRRLADDVVDESEVMADDHAAGSDPLPLASALVKLGGAGTGAIMPEVAGFERADLMTRRVRRLLGLETRIGTHVTRRSIAAAAMLLSIVWISGLLMVHPDAGAAEGHAGSARAHATPVHCRHYDAGPWTHLFCRGVAPEDGGPCPHA